ncbi:hypothetical protein [Robbsia sp. KACC 23696]|uniref:hypothetical protein n=1 Tax=Robbsia sp. KACC 23696 TaxID=3149231 RepID=UPI00325C1AA8
MNRKSGVVAAAALLGGAAVWLWRHSLASSGEAQQARPLSRWENEGGAPAAASNGETPRRSKRPLPASNSEAVGSTPDEWVFPRA